MKHLWIAARLEAAYQIDVVQSYGWERWTRRDYLRDSMASDGWRRLHKMIYRYIP